ncbi:hypothetical protein [Hymenobacter fodinae]|uniref:Uncharacterized protein n=1 Tax=Hymenobacter fodinae TaxID=2510796 RepID=A0A4Z0P1A3_9BACT|nr:hypothetical protein [Hymenobacter fodinae]TGE04711.1 hypothetical protein EU556_21255 [Hymenobacter fodinae]
MPNLPHARPLAISLLLSSALMVANILLGHYYGPSGIVLTPLVLMALTGWLLPRHSQYSQNLLRVGLLALLICLQDAGTKLFAGGSHDAEGQGVIHAFLFMGLLPVFGYIVYMLRRQRAEPPGSRILAGLLFPVAVGLYLWLFANLGYNCDYGC